MTRSMDAVRCPRRCSPSSSPPITLIDLDRRIIPNRLTGAAAAGGAGARGDRRSVERAGCSPPPVWPAARSWSSRWASPAGMGMGDVKLVAVLGLSLVRRSRWPWSSRWRRWERSPGWRSWSGVGCLAGRRATMPIGPFLALGGARGRLRRPGAARPVRARDLRRTIYASNRDDRGKYAAVSVRLDASALDYTILAIYFVVVLGIGASRA